MDARKFLKTQAIVVPSLFKLFTKICFFATFIIWRLKNCLIKQLFRFRIFQQQISHYMTIVECNALPSELPGAFQIAAHPVHAFPSRYIAHQGLVHSSELKLAALLEE